MSKQVEKAAQSPLPRHEGLYQGEQNRPCECDACEWRGFESDIPDGLAGVEDLFDRIDPGCVVPVGECPECGALAYLVEKESVAPALLEALKAVLQTCEDGVIQRSETGKPQWSALPHMGAIARAAIAQAEGGAQ